MARHRVRSVGLHEERSLATAKAAFIDFAAVPAVMHRQREIDALPVVEHKGRKLRTLRCNGLTGKGPHDYNVPESLLWSLLHLGSWRCPFHA